MDRKDCDRIALTYGTVLFMAFDLNLYVPDPCHGSRTPHLCNHKAEKVTLVPSSKLINPFSARHVNLLMWP